MKFPFWWKSHIYASIHCSQCALSLLNEIMIIMNYSCTPSVSNESQFYDLCIACRCQQVAVFGLCTGALIYV